MKTTVILMAALLSLCASSLEAGEKQNLEVQRKKLEDAVVAILQTVAQKDDKKLAGLLLELDRQPGGPHKATVPRVRGYLGQVKVQEVKFGSMFQDPERQLVGIRTTEPLCLDFTFIRVQRQGKEILLLQAINP